MSGMKRIRAKFTLRELSVLHKTDKSDTHQAVMAVIWTKA